MKVTGTAIVKHDFTVDLDMTVEQFEKLSPYQQNEEFENAIDFYSTSIRSVEIDDDIDYGE